MPNPVSPIKRKEIKRLKPRQKTLVKKLRRAGLPVLVYRRKSNRNKMSVHNPFLDVVRPSKHRAGMKTKIPHARDTKPQQKALKKKRLMASRRKGKIKRAGILLP